MDYFATFDDTGKPTAFYNEAVHGKKTRPVYALTKPKNLLEFPSRVQIGEEPNPTCLIPADAVRISEDEWLGWIGAKEAAPE